MDSISSFFIVFFTYAIYICLDTSYHFLALPLLLKYSLFFLSTPVLTFSIDVVFVISMQIKKLPEVAVVATKRNFLQYTYRFRINHKTLYSQTFPCPHFGSWTISTGSVNLVRFHLVLLRSPCLRVSHSTCIVAIDIICSGEKQNGSSFVMTNDIFLAVWHTKGSIKWVLTISKVDLSWH